MSGWRWGLVTFCGCITCAQIAGPIQQADKGLLIALVALIVSAFGGLAISSGEGK